MASGVNAESEVLTELRKLREENRDTKTLLSTLVGSMTEMKQRVDLLVSVAEQRAGDNKGHFPNIPRRVEPKTQPRHSPSLASDLKIVEGRSESQSGHPQVSCSELQHAGASVSLHEHVKTSDNDLYHRQTQRNERIPSADCRPFSGSVGDQKQGEADRSKHERQKRYHCQHCDKCFSTSSGLQNHQRIHTGEKPYVCEWCSKSFNQLCNLRTHQRIHTGEKPFLCKWCSKTFSQLCNLRSHLRIHTGEKSLPPVRSKSVTSLNTSSC